jgi:putative endonuclease
MAVLRNHAGNPARHQQVIETLAKENGTSVDHVRELYETEHARLCSSVSPSFRIRPMSETDATSSGSWWVYLLACVDGRTYAGVARDVEARFQAHVAGKAAKFTRANRPLRVLGAREFASRSDALKAEYALKQLRRAEKLAWARQSKRARPIAKRPVRARAT